MMLTNKVALITGGARGIGAGIARAMAGQGARVALLDRDGPEAEKTAAGLPAPGLAVACDVAIEAQGGAAVPAASVGALDRWAEAKGARVREPGRARGLSRGRQANGAPRPRANLGGHRPSRGVPGERRRPEHHRAVDLS